MLTNDLFNTDYERRLQEGAVDRLEQRRIDDLNMKMDELANRVKSTDNPEHKKSLLKAFLDCKEERDSYYKLREAGIGQDIVNKSEKMARATPPTKAGAVASTVKNAAKWLAGKGGPGKEGPTYEGADDIEDRGEYDREGDMAKDNIHTIVRNARELESVIGNDDNLPEWVQDKLANIKGMMTAVSEYMQTQHEREGAIPEGTETQWSKEEPWRKVPKNKSGKAVDPRGEVAHMSDVARRETERKTRAQKKNSEKVNEYISMGSDKNYMETEPYKNYKIYVRKKPFGNTGIYTAHTEIDRKEFMGKGPSQEEAVQAIRDRIDFVLNAQKKVTGSSTIDFNVKFATDLLADPRQTFYAKLENIKGQPKLIIAGTDIANDPELLAAGDFKRSTLRNQVDDQGRATPLPGIPLTAKSLRAGEWIANGRYTVGNETTDRDGNRVFDLTYHSTAHTKSDKLRLNQPAFTLGTAREVDEGWQDFNKVEPYAVCLAGKPVKKFDYYEEARRFHDNWKKKLYNQGEKEKADKITLMPLGLDEQGIEENLKKWFKEKWVRFGPDGKIRGDCARGSESEGKPKCLPQSKAHALGKKGRASSAAKKRREDPNPERRGAAKNVATKVKEDDLDENCWKGYHKEGNKELFGKTVPNCVKNESVEGIPFDQCPKCGGAIVHESQLAEKQDACYHKVKSRYKVWPSAYASGALVQCRKKGSANWGNKSESAEQELDEKWSQKYKSSINCSNPKGFSQKAHCAGRKKNEGMFSTLEENNEARDAVESAIIRRIMVSHKDLLMKFGPQKVMQAAEAIADDHADVEEIGTSDVSAYVQEVERYLAMNY